MSGGSDSVTTGLPAFVQPYAENYLQKSQQVADLPYTPYGGQTVAQANPYQTQAWNASAQRAMQGSGVNDAASGELQKTLGGSYLNAGNPYMDDLVNKAQGDVVRNYNTAVRPQQDSLMARSGSFGNSGVQSTINDQQRQFGETLGNVSTQLRGGAYESERNRMQGAVGMAPTIANQDYVDAQMLEKAGQGFQGQEQANLTDSYTRFQQAQNYPKEQLATLGQGLGMNFGGTRTGPAADPLAQGLGAGMAGYSMYKGLGK